MQSLKVPVLEFGFHKKVGTLCLEVLTSKWWQNCRKICQHRNAVLLSWCSSWRTWVWSSSENVWRSHRGYTVLYMKCHSEVLNYVCTMYDLSSLLVCCKPAGEPSVLQQSRWLKDHDQRLWFVKNWRIWRYGNCVWYSWICWYVSVAVSVCSFLIRTCGCVVQTCCGHCCVNLLSFLLIHFTICCCCHCCCLKPIWYSTVKLNKCW